MNIEFANTVLKYIRINLKRTPVTDRIAEKGVQYKFKYTRNKSMPLADAISAATAHEEKAILISGEKHFKKIREIEAKSPKELLQHITP